MLRSLPSDGSFLASEQIKLSHTVTRIEGDRRVTGVYVAPLGADRLPDPEREEFVECDTVLFSVGLIPENELTKKEKIQIDRITKGPVVNQYMQTSAPCVFACGNVVHVNDLVDNVSAESALAGKFAAKYAMGTFPKAAGSVTVSPGSNVRYVCPQSILIPEDKAVTVYFRALKPEANITLEAECCGKTVEKQKKIRVNPGEMDRLQLDLSGCSEGTVTVNIRKED